MIVVFTTNPVVFTTTTVVFTTIITILSCSSQLTLQYLVVLHNYHFNIFATITTILLLEDYSMLYTYVCFLTFVVSCVCVYIKYVDLDNFLTIYQISLSVWDVVIFVFKSCKSSCLDTFNIVGLSDGKLLLEYAFSSTAWHGTILFGRYNFSRKREVF